MLAPFVFSCNYGRGRPRTNSLHFGWRFNVERPYVVDYITNRAPGPLVEAAPRLVARGHHPLVAHKLGPGAHLAAPGGSRHSLASRSGPQ